MRSYPPRHQGSSQASRKPLFFMAGAGVVLAAGILLGWLLFGRGQDQPPPAGASSALATTAAAGESPTARPMETLSADAPALDTATPAPPVSTPTVTTAPTVSSNLLPPGFDGLLSRALDLINQSRSEAGLAPVVWDPAAAAVAQAHAEDMLSGPFFSHWNRAGYGPEHRAALDAGMTDAVFENIHMTRRTGNGQPAPILDWPQRILDAHLSLMDSPGHRRNILDSAHTHVGIGIAYRPELGELRLVQEFVNRYVELDPLPAELPVGAEVEISGRLLAGATDPLINLAYEPFPSPMTIEQLDATSSYQSAAQFFSAPRTTVDGGRFHTRAILDFNGQPGLYHIWVFVTVQNEQVLTASSIVMIDAD